MDYIMETGAKPALDVKALILQAIAEKAYRPVELIDSISSTLGVSESQLKDGLSALVEAHVVELTPDRYVRLRA
jgi:hypothetical protein